MEINQNRKKLLIIIAWFMVPLLFAVFWYKNLPENYQPRRTTNNGDLLESIFTLAPFTHQTQSGEVFTNKDIEKIWTMVHFVSGDCDEACSQSLYKTRQLRIALGKDIDRLNRIVLIDAAEAQTGANQLMWQSHPDLRVLFANPQGIREQITEALAGFEYGQNSVFLIDPLGNVMMHFSADLPPKAIKKDLSKLFKLSRIG